MKNSLFRLMGLLLCLVTFASRAEVTLEIVTQGDHQIPIAVLPFADDSAGGNAIVPVVRADLVRSGLFSSVDATDIHPAPVDETQLNWDVWTGRHADYVVVGNVQVQSDQTIEVRFRVMDVATKVARLSTGFKGPLSQYRMVAHHVADAILENLTGYQGMFSSHIAYITKHRNQRSLKVADSDGYNEQTLITSNEPIISPRWSPDGTKMAYVSFEYQRPMVVVQTLATGRRRIVARFKGSNSAPAWLPDGKHLAVALTKDSHSQIYMINVDGTGAPQRLTFSSGIDTEPFFTADGKTMYFTSDRDGGPQIYRTELFSSDLPQRLTYGSTYAVSPRVSPDGKLLAFVQRDEGAFHVMLQDLATGQSQVMTDTTLDESPSFAPNGKYIMYSTQLQDRGILSIVSTDGRIRQRLTTQTGDVYEPVWGPLQ